MRFPYSLSFHVEGTQSYQPIVLDTQPFKNSARHIHTLTREHTHKNRRTHSSCFLKSYFLKICNSSGRYPGNLLQRCLLVLLYHQESKNWDGDYELHNGESWMFRDYEKILNKFQITSITNVDTFS